MAWRVNVARVLSSLNFAKIIEEKSEEEQERMWGWLYLAMITAYITYFSFAVSRFCLFTFVGFIGKWVEQYTWGTFYLIVLSLLAPMLALLIECLFSLLLFKRLKIWKPNILKPLLSTILPTISAVLTPFVDTGHFLFVALVTSAACSLAFSVAIISLEDLKMTQSLFSLSLAYLIYFREDFVVSIVFLFFLMDNWLIDMLHYIASFSSALPPSTSSLVDDNNFKTLSQKKGVAYAAGNGIGSESSALMKFDEKADNVPIPIVRLDQYSEPDTTILQASFRNDLGTLIDTKKVLKDLGLDVVKGTVATEGLVNWATFFISPLATERKVEYHALLDRIHSIVSNNLLKHDQELSKQLSMGGGFRIQAWDKKHFLKNNEEIPTVDEATLNHERLQKRLEMYDLIKLQVSGDGNCQFRSLSDQMYGTTEHHKFVREQVVNQLKSDPERYMSYVPMAYDDYLKKMSVIGEWGDHVTLQAAADLYGIKIFVIMSLKESCCIEILPRVWESKRTIFLSFLAEAHYNSVYPRGDFPVPGTKQWWCWW